MLLHSGSVKESVDGAVIYRTQVTNLYIIESCSLYYHLKLSVIALLLRIEGLSGKIAVALVHCSKVV